MTSNLPCVYEELWWDGVALGRVGPASCPSVRGILPSLAVSCTDSQLWLFTPVVCVRHSPFADSTAISSRDELRGRPTTRRGPACFLVTVLNSRLRAVLNGRLRGGSAGSSPAKAASVLLACLKSTPLYASYSAAMRTGPQLNSPDRREPQQRLTPLPPSSAPTSPGSRRVVVRPVFRPFRTETVVMDERGVATAWASECNQVADCA